LSTLEPPNSDKPKMTKVSVVILNYNGRKYLQQFLPSVISYSKEAQIVVVDNASTDDSREFLKNQYPFIELVYLTENVGYAGGYNEALKQIESEYFVLLNSDIEVTDNWLNPIIELMESDDGVAAAQPKIKSFKNQEYFEYAGAAGGFIDFLGYPFCQGRIFNSSEKDTGQYDQMREIFWASGACFIVRAKAFHEMGGFDPDFFAHMEEIDLCWRLHNKGYRIMAYPQSTVFHVGAGTLPVTNPRKTYLNFNNNLAMLTKNLPASQILKLPLRILLDWIAALKFLLDGSPNHSWAVIRAHLNYFGKLNLTIRKRSPNISSQNGKIYHRSIVFDYYLLGRKMFGDLNWKAFDK